MKSRRLQYQCNICGTQCKNKITDLTRENPTCPNCGSTVRMRAIIYLLSINLFKSSLILDDFPVRKDLYGLGMSDWDGYAIILTQKCSYTNTFYHKEPHLDIAKQLDPHLFGKYDFIISSDVFEHVNPPISVSFNNVKDLLKPHGFLIFTVPYEKYGEIKEHFPNLYKYEIIETDGQYILKNTTKSNEVQIYDNLVFHGGEGDTLEMRVFSENSIITQMRKAGFNKIDICHEDYLEYGIHWDVNWSLPIIARL